MILCLESSGRVIWKMQCYILCQLCIVQPQASECHKWFRRDKIMTTSEEMAADKFTLEYYVKTSKEEEVCLQKDLIWCLNFAAEAHKDQRRKDEEKTPYINHPIGVAYIISEEGGMTNLDLIRGALLHDTVEDTHVVIELIRAKFGAYIGDLVQEVTDDKTLPKEKRKELQVIHAGTTSPQGKVVKLADKLYNLRDLDRSLPLGWTEERRIKYYKWAFQVCEGLRGVNPTLEEKLDEFFLRKGLISQPEPHSNTLNTHDWPVHNEIKPLLNAANFAALKHRRHMLFDVTNSVPYINHLVSVAFTVSQEADIQVIPVLCAAFLQDVVGKTDVTIDDVIETFGREVGQLVSELTYNHSLCLEDQFKSQMNRVANMSYNARVITLATVIDNCRRLEVFEPEGWSHERRENYFMWCFKLCSLLANTQPQLEQELTHVWVGQGLKEFPMKSREKPKEI